MYDQFYGLQGRPFQLTPDPHYYFESATHRKALSYLGYGLAQGEGFIVITGDIGAGKTTLVGHLMQTIDPARLTAVKIVSTQVEGDDMLRLAAQSFGLTLDGQPKAQVLRQIEGFLHGQARAGRRTLLIVDEAQNLPVSAIEELRMLSNFQLGGQSLLQIFLLGQPEFRDLVKSPELEQLRQRVIATHHLEPMMPQEIEPYIIHRLSVAGWSGNPYFTPEAFAALYGATDGVPRRVNALVSRVLLLGAIDQLAQIDQDVVQAVIADMGIDSDRTPEPVAPSVLDSAPDIAVEQEAPIADEDDVLNLYDDSVADGAWEPSDAPFAPPPFVPSPFAPSPFDRAEEPAGAYIQEQVEENEVDEEDILPFAYRPPVLADGDEQGFSVAPELEAPEAEVAEPAVTELEAPELEAPEAEVAELEAPEPEVGEPEVGEPEVGEPEVDGVAAGDDAIPAAMMEEIEALRAEIASLRAVQSHVPFTPAPTIDPEALKDCFLLIEERLASLEFRVQEQDTALRRVLTLLVDWVEREARTGETLRDAAA